ncbi:MAG: AbrB/MazE/SpoVT family DNA-binding domain-containing protein [Bacillota bacterium]
MSRSITKISSKRQITVPAAFCKALGIEPGEKVLIEIVEGKLVISPGAKSYTELLSGCLNGVYGTSKEEIEAYIRRERTSWEEKPF